MSAARPILGVVLSLLTIPAASRAQPAAVKVSKQERQAERLLRGAQETQAVRIIHTPEPEEFELALDEMQLDWTRAGSRRRNLAAAAEGAGHRVDKLDPLRAVVRLTAVQDTMALTRVLQTLESLNPGAQGHLVLYAADAPRDVTSRRLLTREVAVLLEEGADPGALLPATSVDQVRPVLGVPRAYVIDATDPLASLQLASELRERPGVRSAYPLLRRMMHTRSLEGRPPQDAQASPSVSDSTPRVPDTLLENQWHLKSRRYKRKVWK